MCHIADKLSKMLRKRKKQDFNISDLVEEYHDMVYRCCYSFLFNKEDAEDVCQEVFISVFNSLHRFNHDSKISTWITRIAINKSLNFIRANKQMKHAEIGADCIDLTAEHHEEEELKELRKTILAKLINELPEKQRVAFVMNKYNGLTAKEIAEVESCSVNSIEVLIHRAFKSISKKAIDIYNNKQNNQV